MRYLKIVAIIFLLVTAMGFTIFGGNPVFADEEYEYGERHHHDKEDERYEDVGELIGWATVIAVGVAGFLYPVRKSAKWFISKAPKFKNLLLSISKFLGKYHLLFGITALALGIFHGIIMYISKGELESEGITGLGAILFMAIAGIFGFALFKNKKAKSLRTTHKVLITFSIFTGLIHIFIA